LTSNFFGQKLFLREAQFWAIFEQNWAHFSQNGWSRCRLFSAAGHKMKGYLLLFVGHNKAKKVILFIFVFLPLPTFTEAINSNLSLGGGAAVEI
jgi:hypothetical protein